MVYGTVLQLRSERAETARQNGLSDPEGEIRSFLDTVLSACETHGVDELVLSMIGDFLKAKYGGTDGAKNKLGDSPKIRNVFMDILAHLHAP